jgi:glycosyltransferase involved in cell wall biosynthesis
MARIKPAQRIHFTSAHLNARLHEMIEGDTDRRWIDSHGETGLTSVLIPAYNAQTTITATLDSVWKQTYRPIEVVLIDDGSTDNTDAAIQAWTSSIPSRSDFIVRYFRQSNKGLLPCRNRSTLQSLGEYLQYLDADDLLHPEKLESSINVLRKDVNTDVVVVRTLCFTEENEALEALRLPAKVRAWGDAEIGVPILSRAFWYTLGPVFRRRIVEAAGPFPLKVHPVAEEVEFHARVKCVTNRIHYLPEVLTFHRVGGKSQLTGQLARVYRGKIDAVRWIEKIMLENGIADSREWRGLLRYSLSTTYAIGACSPDRGLFEESLRQTKNLARSRGNLLSMVLSLIPSSLGVGVCKSVYAMRNRGD